MTTALVYLFLIAVSVLTVVVAMTERDGSDGRPGT
jgi:hypothetical protein